MPQLPQIDSLKAPDRAVAQATRTRRFPWLNLPFVVVVALIVCYGLVVVMSAVANDPDYSFSRQLAGVAAGIVAMIVAWRFDYRRLSDFTTLFLIVNWVILQRTRFSRRASARDLRVAFFSTRTSWELM